MLPLAPTVADILGQPLACSDLACCGRSNVGTRQASSHCASGWAR
ncbi:hypothetical protein [Psychrobacter lutiphocae]|nr:hypothetical protein [Psychrobacter lutiphocae]